MEALAESDGARTLPVISCPTCGALLTEDRQFRLDAFHAEMTIRRYGCMNGHSVYTGMEDRDVTWQPSRNMTGYERKSCRPRGYE